jgi:hypothetical protein
MLTSARENRIVDEILVDACRPEEQAMAWYYYLEGKLTFQFVARCIKPRSISPLKKGEQVEVVGLAKEEDCDREMFVLVSFGGRKVGVPLAQLEVVIGTSATREAVDDWRWWAATEPQR